jgi:4-oxalocrotonate tautomerase
MSPVIQQKDTIMPFVNFKLPEGALSKAQKEELIHRTTDLLVGYLSEAARPYTMVLIETVPDGGYGRADEVFVIPEAYRARDEG